MQLQDSMSKLMQTNANQQKMIITVNFHNSELHTNDNFNSHQIRLS